MPGSKLNKHRRENLRASILIVLNVARPSTTNERTLLLTLRDTEDQVSPNQLRRELTYLEGKDLVDVDSGESVWRAQLTSYGIDVVEGAVKKPHGIAELSY